MSLEINPSGFDVGAEVRGIDIAKPLSPEILMELEAAFVAHQVLLFRDQPLTPQAFAAFSAQFGHLQRHIQKAFWHPNVPEIVYNRNVDESGKFDEMAARRGVTDNLREGWHSDTTYDEVPAKATSVHAMEVPSHGGATCFASAHRAYDLLPDSVRRRVSGLRVEFALGSNPRNAQAQFLSQKLTQEDQSRPTVSHPVICRHPISHRPAIYASPLLSVRISGIDEAESDDLLETLYDYIHAASADGYRWDHHWRVGDTVIWENRGGLMHTGRLDYPRDERRIMIRCTIGSSPIEPYSA